MHLKYNGVFHLRIGSLLRSVSASRRRRGKKTRNVHGNHILGDMTRVSSEYCIYAIAIYTHTHLTTNPRSFTFFPLFGSSHTNTLPLARNIQFFQSHRLILDVGHIKRQAPPALLVFPFTKFCNLFNGAIECAAVSMFHTLCS